MAEIRCPYSHLPNFEAKTEKFAKLFKGTVSRDFQHFFD